MESYYTYIIRSATSYRYYVGSYQNIDERLKRHNSREIKSTKYGVPWKLIYSEQFKTRGEAYRREKEIKSYKGGNAFKKLVE